MKQNLLKTWLVMLCMLVGIGSAWAGDVTVSKTMSAVVSENEYTVSSGSTINTICTSIDLDDNINVSLSVGSDGNSGSFWGTAPNIDWRLYQANSPSIILTANNSCTIKSVKFTYTKNNSGVINTIGCGKSISNSKDQINSGQSYDVNATTVTYYVGNSGSATNGQARITAIEVVYSSDGGEVTPPATQQYSYTLETIGSGTTTFKDASGNTIAPNQKVDSGTKIYPKFTPAAGYEFTSWEYYTTAGAWSKLTGNDFTISKDVQFRVTFTAVGGDDPTPGEGNSETYTFSSFTQGSDVTLESTNYTVTLHKNTGSTAPQWNANSNEARVYAKGSVVVTSEKNIVKVVYDYTVNANKNNVAPTIDGVSGANDAGTWDASTKTWTGKDTEVTLTTSGSAGNLGFKSITVYFEEESTPETPSITISAAGVATYYNSTYSYKMPKGLTGYWVSAAYGEDGIGLLELTDSYLADVVVPAGEALIIKGAAGTYELEAGTTDYKPYGDNRLKGTDEAATTTGGDVYYKLAVDPESGLGFYWGAENGTAFTNGAHKAYLALTSEEAGVSGAKGFVLNFDDATAISTVKTSVNANVAYNLAGQRVNANTKGIVIMNGKKYLNK